MKRFSSLPLILSLFFFFIIPTYSYAINFDISVGALRQDPSGSLEYKGTRVDVEEDLNLPRKTKPYIRVKMEHPVTFLPDLYLQFIPTKFTGQNTITRDIEYGGKIFQANTDLSSKLKLDHYDIGLYTNLRFIQKGTNDVLDPELGLNVRIIDFEGTLRGTELGTGTQISESKSLTVPVPMLYAGLGVNIPGAPLSLRGEIRALPISKLSYYDITGELRIKPVKPVYLSVGYRYEKIKIDDIKDLYSNLKIKGPFVMVGVEF